MIDHTGFHHMQYGGGMVSKRFILMLCAALLCGVFVAACGDDSSSSGGGGGGAASGGESSGQTDGAKKIDPAAMDSAKGEVTYCQGKDTSGNAHYMVDEFNKKFGPDLKVKLVEFPASADEQRNQFIQRQQAKSGDCDVFSSDVIWTAEFASQKWLYDLTPYMQDKKSEFIGAPIETVTYDGKIWGSPESSDAGLLYYNTDKVKSVPATWQEVYADAAKNGGITYQGAAYEGLTCDFLELFFAAGGEVLSEDGTKSTFAEGDAATKTISFMADGIKNGAAPKAVTTYMEPESLTAFQTGKYAYMRNWPYAYALNQKAAKIKDNFDVAPQPGFEGGEKAGILGGHNSVISVYSKNPGGALKLVDFIGSPEIQKAYAAQFSLAPVRAEVYDDPAVKKALPFAADLRQAITQARARPVSPVYPQISQAIYKNVNAALSGQQSPEDAAKKAQADIEKALSTF
jgi:multiple sugar transport system substrate-binding protein